MAWEMKRLGDHLQCCRVTNSKKLQLLARYNQICQCLLLCKSSTTSSSKCRIWSQFLIYRAKGRNTRKFARSFLLRNLGQACPVKLTIYIWVEKRWSWLTGVRAVLQKCQIIPNRSRGVSRAVLPLFQHHENLGIWASAALHYCSPSETSSSS